MLVVTEALQTCGACPSQWEGRTEDGAHVYARYRWGYLRVSVGPTADDAVSSGWQDSAGHDVFGAQLGEEFDGYLDHAELAEATRDVISWPWDREGDTARPAQET